MLNAVSFSLSGSLSGFVTSLSVIASVVPPRCDQRDGALTPRSPVERLFAMSLDMLGTASLDGYFMHLNPAWERTLGWTSEQLMAEPFISFVHPDDVDATLEHARVLGAESGAQVVSFENRYRTSSGDFRWINWVGVSDAEAMYFVGRDVTEDKLAVTKLEQDASVMQAVLEGVADGLYVADSHGDMTFMNPAGCGCWATDQPLSSLAAPRTRPFITATQAEWPIGLRTVRCRTFPPVAYPSMSMRMSSRAMTARRWRFRTPRHQ